jgi:hypothetical protein
MNFAFGHVFPSSIEREKSARARLIWIGLWAALFGVWFAPEHARANDDLDSAIEHAEDADFDAALASFDAAIASGTLTRDELIVLLSQRALVWHAVGNDNALGRDLSLLAMLAPDRELGRAAPPPLVARWHELRATQGAALSVHGSCGPSASGTQLAAQVEGLRDAELGQVFIHTRRPGGEWVQKQAASVDIPSGDDGVEYYIRVLGPGGVDLASEGSEDAPLVCAPVREAGFALAGPVDSPRRSNRKMWWWVGGAAVLVGVAAVTTAVLLKRDDGSSDRTTVSKPMVSF